MSRGTGLVILGLTFNSTWTYHVTDADMFYEITISLISSLIFVCIRIVSGHSFVYHGNPHFNCIFCIQSNLEFKF